MNRIDFSFTGGFPLDQDVLDFMQQSYRDGFKALFADAGNTPVIISGMVRSISVTTLNVTAGYFYYLGEIVYFPGGSISTVTTPPDEVCIFIFETALVSSIFEDTSTHDVMLVRVSTLTHQPPPSAANFFVVWELRTWYEVFGEVGRAASVWQSISSTSSSVSGSISYRKDRFANTLHVRGAITIITTSSFPSDPPQYYNSTGYGFAALAATYRPTVTVPLRFLYRYHGSSIVETNGKDYVQGINGELRTDGTFAFGLLRTSAPTTYTVAIDQIISLD